MLEVKIGKEKEMKVISDLGAKVWGFGGKGYMIARAPVDIAMMFVT